MKKQNLIFIVGVVLFIFFLIALVKYFRVSDNQQINSVMIDNQQKDKNGTLTPINNGITPSSVAISSIDNTANTNSKTMSNEINFVPNTNWSDKTLNINGKQLTYRFSEGNPPEVALNPEQYLPRGDKDGIPYVTPKAEQQLKEFLSDKNLPELLNKCANFVNNQVIVQNPNVPREQLVSLMNNSNFDIENYLVIDKETGRKTINPNVDYKINDFLNTLNNPLERSPLVMQCFGLNRMDDFNKIQSEFQQLGREYTNTGAGIKGSEWKNQFENQQNSQ